MKLYLVFLLSIVYYGCAIPSSNQNTTSDTTSEKMLHYLALGDSYTIGESVAINERWPILLKKAIDTKGYNLEKPTIIAKTGWRTDNLLAAIKPTLHSHKKYDLVSVLIGVNNQFQGASIETYEKDLRQLFNQAIALCKNGKEGVFVLSIPDYGATPYGAARAASIGRAIDKWNAVYQKVSLEYQFAWYNITSISRTATKDKSLVAPDGLHPSGKMYQLWVDQIASSVVALLK